MEMKKLSAQLRSARLAQGLTLRDIEELSGGEISNGYASQVERGMITEITPPKLRVLARVLKLSFLELMISAGYLTVKDLKGRV